MKLSANLSEFLTKIENESGAAERMTSLSEMDEANAKEALQSWADEYGIHLSDDDLLIEADEGELSMMEMDNVSGGKFSISTCLDNVIGGIGKIKDLFIKTIISPLKGFE